MKGFKILDCTLRDGGYYTNWDFDGGLVKNYLAAMNSLPIDYIEIGYRNPNLSGYFGEFYFLPLHTLQRIKSISSKKIAIILNEKDIPEPILDELLLPCVGIVDLVRIAVDPVNFERALSLAKKIKAFGFDVAFNVMYMSKWGDYPEMLSALTELDGIVDFFYMVDSFGGVFPDDVRRTIRDIRSRSKVQIGFHGHNNLEMALANTLAAIEEGVEIIDATITGMGRGAGNLKTEILLVALQSKGLLQIDYTHLSKTVNDFNELQSVHKWGTSLPYMVSGANSLPQKQVMEWIVKRFYSFNSIVRALQNQANGIKDNYSLDSWEFDTFKSDSILVIGGGQSVQINSTAILEFLKKNDDLVIIHTSSRNAQIFESVRNRQIFCLLGNEGSRIEQIFHDKLPENAICILPPSPRKMGTYIPQHLISRSYELDSNIINLENEESVTDIALSIGELLDTQKVYLVGYDGYDSDINPEKLSLFNENERIFNKKQHLNITSMTSTRYENVIHGSIFNILK